MSYNILAVNNGHNGSAALVIDGKLKVYLEEERLSRFKYDGNPFRVVSEIVKKYRIDEIVIGGQNQFLQNPPKLEYTGEDPLGGFVRKFYPNVKVTDKRDNHHLGHAAAAFFNSGFESCVSVVVDGCGSNGNPLHLDPTFEVESIFHCINQFKIKPIYKSYGMNCSPFQKYETGNMEFVYDGSAGITKVYEAVSEYLGFGFIEAGKTMGLAPYGKYDERFKDLYIGGRGNKNMVFPTYCIGAYIDTEKYKFLKLTDNKSWHNDESLVTEEMKNIAWAVQNQSQELVGDLVQKAIDVTGETNVTLSGGYGLNCVTNYYLKKRFPNINFFVDPASHDGGTVIGLAKLAFMEYCNNNYITPVKDALNSLYLGPDRTDEIQSFETPEDYREKEVSYSDVAELIAGGSIITIFQNRSEAGPRALGNRSVLFDPRVQDGKDIVNKVKGREWFRPFAGSVLLEDANDWFDMAGLAESPYMMYAVDVLPEKVDLIPAITHVDNTCRVQTVTNQQNPHYYSLISAFKELTGCPILFNTSFNLAGQPLVETLDDAIFTLENSALKYLYLPEAGKLLIKQ
jgi:carbamoyltransferase